MATMGYLLVSFVCLGSGNIYHLDTARKSLFEESRSYVNHNTARSSKHIAHEWVESFINKREKRDAMGSLLESEGKSIDGKVYQTISRGIRFSAVGPHNINKRNTDDSGWGNNIEELIKFNSSVAVLEFIEQMSQDADSYCRVKLPDIIYTLLRNSIPADYYNIMFGSQIENTIRTSNLLTNLFKTWELSSTTDGTMYNKYFYFSLAKSVAGSNKTNFGTAIAFYNAAFKKSENPQSSTDFFCPFVYRKKTSSGAELKTIDMALLKTISFYNTQDWFTEMKNNYNKLLWDYYTKEVCKNSSNLDIATPHVTNEYGKWFGPEFNCWEVLPKVLTISYSVPFFGCIINDTYKFKGVVNTAIDLGQIDINQCSLDPDQPFSDTHKCKRDSTVCEHVPGFGFRRGSYKCVCKNGYYLNGSSNHEDYFNGTEVERFYVQYVLNKSRFYEEHFNCLPCNKNCDCNHCFVEYDILIRGVPLGLTSFCMTIVLVIAYALVRHRKSKVMKASFWLLLEIFIFGALLLYSTIIIQYFEPTDITCLLIPWFREVGFAIVYGALVLKIYRVLAEFQSRKAHRVHVRDKDLLKWLFCIVCVVIGYMAAWTALNLDHIKANSTLLDTGRTHDGLHYSVCKSSWWDILIEIGEFIYLCVGIYLCYCIRSAPSDYLETRYISWAIYNETFISAILHITRHIVWSIINPDYIFLMYFIRCQLTVTVNLALVLGPKLYYSHRPPEDESYRNRAYSTSDVQDNVLPESVKLHVGVNSNGDVDVGEINLSEMDPEDIRTELKRLYTQLQIYKTKTMRKDNPHISKRRGGRKHTHRRFSLQAFHHKHRHHHSHHHHPSASEVSVDHDTEMSRTPEESTNSNEGYGYSIEESTCSVQEVRTPTVTFKPGHKTIY